MATKTNRTIMANLLTVVNLSARPCEIVKTGARTGRKLRKKKTKQMAV